MTFRNRLLIVLPLAVVLPMLLLSFFIRTEMTRRLTAQYESRVESLMAVVEQDLDDERRAIASSLAIIRKRIVADSRFRRATVDRLPEERRYLIDYAFDAMQLAGLSMLQIQDDSGRIISSGHFRNEFDRLDPAVPRLLRETGGQSALLETRAPDAPFVALAVLDSFTISGAHFDLVGGVAIKRSFLVALSPNEDLTLTIDYPDGRVSSSEHVPVGDEIRRELEIPFVASDASAAGKATIHAAHRLDELRTLRSSLDRWFAVAIVIAALFSIAVVTWLASRISRPLAELADKTSRVDLDRLEEDFASARNDEIGTLSRVLASMIERLRVSAGLIKDAERRATLGELARQVNHDIKNGLTPVRNVLRHLDELARTDEQALARVFRERQTTLDSGIAYLENLASNYARLSPKREQQPCDVNAVAARVARDASASAKARVTWRPDGDATILGDPVAVRRVLENLVANAIDAVAGREDGHVEIKTGRARTEDDECVRVTVSDNGHGIPDSDQDRVFDDFYTTRADGTGLGLSIVRRLVMDLDGSIRVESSPGEGSRFIIDLPPAESLSKGTVS